MRINSKALALLTAAIVLGAGPTACQRAGEDQTTGSQTSSAPMNQAPTQGYTGPAGSAPAPGSAEEKQQSPSGSGNTGSQSDSSTTSNTTTQQRTDTNR